MPTNGTRSIASPETSMIHAEQGSLSDQTMDLIGIQYRKIHLQTIKRTVPVRCLAGCLISSKNCYERERRLTA